MARRTTSRTRSRDEDEDQYEEKGPYRDDDEEQDDAPRARRGRSRSDSDADEDESPRSRRAGRSRGRDADDDDQDERPSRGRGRSRGDDDEDKPKRERGRSTTAGRGWGGFEKVKDLGGEFVNAWKFPKKPTLIKFLEPEPFAVYAEHWLDEVPKGTKKSYVCLGDDCPLCDDLGDRPSAYALFNILDLTDPDNPKNEFLRASKTLTKSIQVFAEDKRSKPIDRWDVYFTLYREDVKGARPQLAFVKARDVEEDFDITPFEEDELDEFRDNLVTEEQAVFINSKKQLADVVALVDDYSS